MIIFPNINPVIARFGPLSINWYSLSYVVGILLGWQYSVKFLLKYKPNITQKCFDDLITWIIVGIIVGGRLGHVLLYDPIYYYHNPIEIFMTYKGGMSFHGALVGVIITVYVFSKLNKVNFFDLGDIIVTAAPIGLTLGRIANFINAELYGRVTNVEWAVLFPNEYLPRHPSQLYEAALEGILLFIIMAYGTFKLNLLKRKGIMIGLFLLFYSIFRILVEFFREPESELIFGIFSMGQIFCVPMVIFSIYLFLNANANRAQN